MKKSSILFVSLFLVSQHGFSQNAATAPAAKAKPSAKKKNTLELPPSSIPTEVSIPVQVPTTLPQSESALLTVENEATIRERSHVQIHATFSPWIPEKLSIESRIPLQNPEFKRGNIPTLGLSLMSKPLVDTRWVRATLVNGLGFSLIEREGSIEVDRAQFADKQRVYIVPVHLGAELTSHVVRLRYLVPFVRISANPTMVSTNKTIMGNGRTYFGGYTQFMGGASFRMNWINDLLDPEAARNYQTGWAIDVAWASNFSPFNNLDLTGSTVLAGLRITL